MSHNERGLRIDGAPVKRRKCYRCGILPISEFAPAVQADPAAFKGKRVFCASCRDAWILREVLGRPNAKRAQLAPEDGE